MCGIAGIFYFNQVTQNKFCDHAGVLDLLRHRGPDSQTFKEFNRAALYHSRLSIIDTSAASNQPFLSEDKQTGLVFNGEIFNYKELQPQFDHLKTNGDTEVLFNELNAKGKDCLNMLNGFFAFGYYNEYKHALLLARDRFGVKPLYYFKDDEKCVFASELKPLLKIIGPQALDHDQVYAYFRLNYCAGPQTIFKNVYRLLPGQCIEITDNHFSVDTWYKAPKAESKHSIVELLDDAVKLRLHADVPVGTFLSGGLDSSIISALAIKHKRDLNTFSIGFESESYFDETGYSESVAKHIGSNHHVFKLKEDDFLNNVSDFLKCIDEPFADSSAFNFYLLSKYTRQHVKVALSGDGADELFKGYNKHKALLMSGDTKSALLAKTASVMFPLSSNSRDGYLKNKIRQLKKFNDLIKLSGAEKQKFLASISTDEACHLLLLQKNDASCFNALFKTTHSLSDFNINDTFDIQTVLADDMLVKADRFSMQQGIEIRNPFLDYRVVEFALNLGNDQKISKTGQKIILKNNFANLLPKDIVSRSKKGFELPLQKWLSNNLRSTVENDWLNKDKINSEQLLNYAYIGELKSKVFSGNAGDSAAKLWAVIIFESWMQNFKDYIKR